MLKRKITDYVSEIDQYFIEFDRTHTLSNSQIAEIKKYEQIYRLRDEVQPSIVDYDFWDDYL